MQAGLNWCAECVIINDLRTSYMKCICINWQEMCLRDNTIQREIIERKHEKMHSKVHVAWQTHVYLFTLLQC